MDAWIRGRPETVHVSADRFRITSHSTLSAAVDPVRTPATEIALAGHPGAAGLTLVALPCAHPAAIQVIPSARTTTPDRTLWLIIRSYAARAANRWRWRNGNATPRAGDRSLRDRNVGPRLPPAARAVGGRISDLTGPTGV